MPKWVVGDRGYTSHRFREHIWGMGARPAIPPQRHEAPVACPEWIYTNYPSRTGSGTPKFFAREGDTLIFGPAPEAGLTIKGRFYKRLAALSDTNTTNWFITNEPQLLRFAALCEAAPYLKDDKRIPIWENKYNDAKNRIKKTERDEEFSGSQLSVTAG